MKRFLIAIAVALATLPLSAQELKMSGFEHRTMDLDGATGAENHLDGNGNPAALLKVNSTVGELTFESPMILGQPEQRSNGEYWIWLAGGANYLNIRSAGKTPLLAKFERVEPKSTYVMNVVEQKGSTLDKMITVTVQPMLGGGSIGGMTTVKNEPVDFNLILVEPGMFEMGATAEQAGADSDEKPVHWVNITRPFYIGETEVTQELWRAVMGENPSFFHGDKLPVESVSHEQIDDFIKRLSAQFGVTFRLPTEAEWEYAARGGQMLANTVYAGGEDAGSVGWYKANSMNKTHEVKQKAPNALGIYDMSGNVFELVRDNKKNYEKGEATDPVVIDRKADRVRRGGSWTSETPNDLRTAFRRRSSGAARDTGLRLVLEPSYR